MGQALKFNTVSYAYGNFTWGDLLTKYGGTAISYDAIIVLTVNTSTGAMHYFAGVSAGDGHFKFYNSALKFKGVDIDGSKLTIAELLYVISEYGKLPVCIMGFKGYE